MLSCCLHFSGPTMPILILFRRPWNPFQQSHLSKLQRVDLCYKYVFLKNVYSLRRRTVLVPLILGQIRSHLEIFDTFLLTSVEGWQVVHYQYLWTHPEVRPDVSGTVRTPDHLHMADGRRLETVVVSTDSAVSMKRRPSTGCTSSTIKHKNRIVKKKKLTW